MKMRRILCLAVAILMVTLMAASCGGKKSDYIVLDEIFATEDYALGFRKGDNALTLKVQEILDEMIKDGKAAEISNKWFGEDKILKNQSFPGTIGDGSDSSLDDLMARGTLILGLDVGFAPMGFYDENGEYGPTGDIVGIDIDLAREVCKRLGVTLKLQPIEWAAKEMELNAGNIDVIWNGMSVTQERIEAMNISKPYLKNRMVVIAKADAGIKKLADLSGKIVGVQAGSSAIDAINSKPDIAASFANLAEYDTNTMAFLELKIGRIDALVVDEVVGLNLIERFGAIEETEAEVAEDVDVEEEEG